jgi:hypothetical protein
MINSKQRRWSRLRRSQGRSDQIPISRRVTMPVENTVALEEIGDLSLK